MSKPMAHLNLGVTWREGLKQMKMGKIGKEIGKMGKGAWRDMGGGTEVGTTKEGRMRKRKMKKSGNFRASFILHLHNA